MEMINKKMVQTTQSINAVIKSTKLECPFNVDNVYPSMLITTVAMKITMNRSVKVE